VRVTLERTDADIAADALSALRLRIGIPEQVQVVVHDGYVTLTGTVERVLQKELADDVVRHIRGVRGVFDHTEVAPLVLHREVKRRIVQALHRAADVDARHVQVAVDGGVVTLTGMVRSWPQRDAAEAAASRAPGVRRIDNQLFVVPRDTTSFITELC
jgi:osmotically-inducible protein OsmY